MSKFFMAKMISTVDGNETCLFSFISAPDQRMGQNKLLELIKSGEYSHNDLDEDQIVEGGFSFGGGEQVVSLHSITEISESTFKEVVNIL